MCAQREWLFSFALEVSQASPAVNAELSAQEQNKNSNHIVGEWCSAELVGLHFIHSVQRSLLQQVLIFVGI